MFRFFLPDKSFDKKHLATARTYSPSLLKHVMQLDKIGGLSKEKIEAFLSPEYKEISQLTAAESKSEKKEDDKQIKVSGAPLEKTLTKSIVDEFKSL